jgi:crotonobetainyl-CoA:carnitine CoA-transferase CaiB-like acyl-CoA transferase
MTEAGALSGIRVLDFTQHTAGPYCTKLMAGLGAEVIKVEPPGRGDGSRSRGPFFRGTEGVERSIPFLWLNTGKKSVALDLDTPEGLDRAKRLAAGADVVIESFKPGVMERLGLDYGTLALGNPRLVMTSISGFGESGPYRDYEAEEIQLYALSGLMHETGDPNRAPLASGPPLASCTAGLSAFVATVSALYLRERTGRGQRVDVSAQEASLVNIEMSLVNCLQLRQVKKRSGDRHVMVPWEMFECADGEAAVIGGPIRNWRRAAEFLDEPRLFEKRFDYVKDRMAQREEYESLLRPVVKKLEKRHLFHEAQKRNLGFSYLVSLEEALELPQHQARGLFSELDHPVVGRHRYVGAPFKMSKTPWTDGRAPLLSEHSEAIPPRAQTAGKPGTKAEDPGLPFEGLRVVDFTHEWAGPIGTRLLADLGAEVIRIEYPKRLCVVRGARTDDRHYNKHPMWHQVNRNKLSVSVDLRVPDQLQAFKDLVKISDLVINNCRAGVMERHGLGYEDLRRIRPDIVFAALSGFGATGPYSSYAGFGGTIEPLSGLLQLTGYERDGRRYRIREMDVINGLVGICAVVAALFHRKRTGEGQFVDVSQTEAATHALMGEALLELVMNGSQTLPLGNRSPHFAPQGCYRCRGEDRWVTITVRSDEEWRRLCGVMGRAEWADDPRLRCQDGRFRHHNELDEKIESWTRDKDNGEVMRLLQAAGIPAGAVLDTAGLENDPHLRARGYFLRAETNLEGLFPGMFFRLSDGGGRLRRRGPDLGEHNGYVYGELLGRPASGIPTIREEEVGTGYDPE